MGKGGTEGARGGNCGKDRQRERGEGTLGKGETEGAKGGNCGKGRDRGGEGRELWERERQRAVRERDAGKEMRAPVAMTLEFETKCDFSCGRKDSL